MTEYLVDNMVVNNPNFMHAREARKLGHLEYKIIEEIAFEARTNIVDNEKIKAEAKDDHDIEHLTLLVTVAPEMIEANVLKIDEGNGDVMLVVDYLAQSNRPSLLINDRVIVSDDQDLVLYCGTRNIQTTGSEDFFAMITEIIST